MNKECDGDHYYNRPRCPLWHEARRSSSVNDVVTWYNVHAAAPWGGPDVPAENVVAYNIKIWRENPTDHRFELIFERRVGLSSDKDTDPERGANHVMDASRRWWYGDYDDPDGNSFRRGGEQWTRGGTFSNRRATSAGPFGQFSKRDRTQCMNNWERGANGTRKDAPLPKSGKVKTARSDVRPHRRKDMKNSCYWEGADIGPNYFRWGASSGYTNAVLRDRGYGNGRSDSLPDDQFGTEGNHFDGVLGKGLKEAIYVTWDLPLNRTDKSPKFHYSIEGVPGLMYAVQIVALDHAENIMPMKVAGRNDQEKVFLSPDGSAVVGSQQYFRAAMAGWQKLTCRQKKELDPTVECTGGDVPVLIESEEPGAEATLEAEDVVETREHTEQTVSLIAADGIDDMQAIFPTRSSLIHYTPQMQFSDPAISTGYGAYGANYAVYDAEAQNLRLPRSPAPWAPPAQPGHGRFTPQMATLPEVLSLDPTAVASTNLHTQSYGMTWLQPTLDNPCAAFAPPEQQVDEPWPARLDRCQINQAGVATTFNAWDDLLLADISWEARWVSGVRDKTRDWDDAGRIDDELLRCPDAGGPRRSDQCSNSNGFVPLSVSGINRTTGQHAQGYILATDDDDEAAVRVTLETNRPNRITGGGLYPRSIAGPALPNLAANGLRNSRSGDIELNYCAMGIPDGATVAMNSGGDVTIDEDHRPGWLGDDDCAGYALRWQWTETDASCNANLAGNRPQQSRYASQPPNEVATAPGRYHQNWRQDPSFGDRTGYNQSAFSGAPFFGQRPGATGPRTGNVAPCREAGRSGYYTQGQWVVARQAEPGWGNNNSGGPLPAGGYVADFTFGWPSDGEAVSELTTRGGTNPRVSCPNGASGGVVGTCWRMRGSYDGYDNLVWSYANRTDRTDGSFVKVFGPRSSR